MKSPHTLLFGIFAAFLLTGCLTSPVSQSGGLGAVTVRDSNPTAIIGAAQSVFSESGYTVADVNYPDSISFDRAAGTFGEVMWGGWDSPTTIRATLVMTRLPQSNDYRISTRVAHVSDAGEAGFEDATPMLGLWSAEFKPLLKKIAERAGGAGSYF